MEACPRKGKECGLLRNEFVDPNHPIPNSFLCSSFKYEAGRIGESDGHLVLEFIRWKRVRGRGKSAVFCVTNLIRDICHRYCSSARWSDLGLDNPH